MKSGIECNVSFWDEKVTHRDGGSDDRAFDMTFAPRQVDGENIPTCVLDRRLKYSLQLPKLGDVVPTLDSIREGLG